MTATTQIITGPAVMQIGQLDLTFDSEEVEIRPAVFYHCMTLDEVRDFWSWSRWNAS